MGVDIVRYPASDPAFWRVSLLRRAGIDVVLDVGANIGQYASELRRHHYAGRIVSFEPLNDPYSTLRARSAADVGWTTVRTALGRTAGSVTMNVAGNSYSSSVLPMLPAHVRSAPDSAYVAVEEVPVVALDDVYAQHCGPGDAVFLKIDCQGYEREILDGASASLPLVRGLQLEMSLVPLYAGSMLFDEALDRIRTAGFELHAVEPGFADPAGRLLQLDGIFFRPHGQS